MRAIVLHRRAARSLSRMPSDRAAQVRDALREVAGLDDIASMADQDTRPDVLPSDEDGRVWEFLRQANGSFLPNSKVWGGSSPGFASGLTLAAVDLEGDGDLDLIGGLANGGILALRDPNIGRPTGLIARPGATRCNSTGTPTGNRASAVIAFIVPQRKTARGRNW